jgi:hypothetical protein
MPLSIPVTVTSAPDASGMANWRLSVFRPTLPTGLAPGKWRALSVREEVSDARTEEALHP